MTLRYTIGISIASLLFGIDIAYAQSARPVCLAWDPSPSSGVTTYCLYRGTASGQYSRWDDIGNITNVCVTNLATGVMHYFAVTAKDSEGLESVPSNEVSCILPVDGSKPSVPSNLHIESQHQAEYRSMGEGQPYVCYAPYSQMRLWQSCLPQAYWLMGMRTMYQH